MRIEKKFLPIVICLSILSTIQCAATAAETGVDSARNQDEVLDEALVVGSRLYKLRAAVIQSEDRLIAKYNELNKTRDLDIECLNVTPSGTHFSFRYCRTILQKRAQEDDAWIYMANMRAQDSQLGAGGAAPAVPLPEVRIRLQQRQGEYMEHLKKLLQDSPELRQLTNKQNVAHLRYERAMQERRSRKAQPQK